MDSPEDQAASWAANERDLHAAMEEVELDAKTRAEIAEYLDHNELGLAFATLVEALDERGVMPSAVAVELLRASYDRMGRPHDGADAWERLTRTV